MSILYPDVEIPSRNNFKNNSETVLFYIIKQKVALNSLFRWLENILLKLRAEVNPLTSLTVLLL